MLSLFTLPESSPLSLVARSSLTYGPMNFFNSSIRGINLTGLNAGVGTVIIG